MDYMARALRWPGSSKRRSALHCQRACEGPWQTAVQRERVKTTHVGGTARHCTTIAAQEGAPLYTTRNRHVSYPVPLDPHQATPPRWISSTPTSTPRLWPTTPRWCCCGAWRGTWRCWSRSRWRGRRTTRRCVLALGCVLGLVPLAGDLEVLVTQRLAGPQDYAQVCIRIGVCIRVGAPGWGPVTTLWGRPVSVPMGLSQPNYPQLGLKSLESVLGPLPYPGRARRPSFRATLSTLQRSDTTRHKCFKYPQQPMTGPVPLPHPQAQPELRIRSATLCRALFELFLGGSPVVPDARAAWVKGAKLLLDSENVKRESRKAGSG